MTFDRCLAHVINLANIDVMGHITRIAIVESKAAIWDYDPGLPSNHISNGGLDVIATIWTLAIKVSLLQYHYRLLLIVVHHGRFKHQAHALRSSTNFRSNQASRLHSRSPFTAMSDGGLRF